MKSKYNYILSDKEIGILKSLVGKKTNTIRHDKIIYTSTSAGYIGFCIEGKWYSLISDLYECDFTGPRDELGFFSFEEKEVVPFNDALETRINEKITDILLCNDTIELYKADEKISELHYTKGVVFCFESKQYAFYHLHYFNEIICIRKGQDCLKQVPVPDEEWGKDEWNEGFSSINTRHTLHLKELP